MNLTKDTYEYILNFADDRDIMNMLLVNKKFAKNLADDDFFQRIMQRKYHLLIQHKKENETWKSLYLRMVKAIAQIHESLDVPYLFLPNYNPEKFYSAYKAVDLNIIVLIAYVAGSGKYHEILEKLLNKAQPLYSNTSGFFI